MEYAVSFACSLTCFLVMWAALNVAAHMAFKAAVKRDMPWYVVLPIGVLCFLLSVGIFFAFKAVYLWLFPGTDSAPTS